MSEESAQLVYLSKGKCSCCKTTAYAEYKVTPSDTGGSFRLNGVCTGWVLCSWGFRYYKRLHGKTGRPKSK